jgi:hypothetical protein
MDGLQLLEVIKRGLPHCQLVKWDEATATARIYWHGILDVSEISVDGYPVLLVTGPNMEMNWQTDKALQLLDDVVPEVIGRPSPWPDVEALLERLHEMEDDDDADGA